MDDVDRKMFAQLDDDMPAQRVNALEMLRERMNKATPPRKFRDIAAELENTVPLQDYKDEVERHNETKQKLTQYRLANLGLAQALWVKGKWRRHWRGMCGWAAAGAVAWVGFGWITGESAADRAAINNSLGSTLATASFGVGDTKPAIYYPQQGKAYWGVIRGEIVTGRNVDARGQPVTLNCLHLYATPATKSWDSFEKANPYLWPVGWVSWPERATLCKPVTQTAADTQHALDNLIGSQK